MTDLTRIERTGGFIEAVMLSEDWVAEMGHRALILEAHHTTHIEGTRLTLKQAGHLIDGMSVLYRKRIRRCDRVAELSGRI